MFSLGTRVSEDGKTDDNNNNNKKNSLKDIKVLRCRILSFRSYNDEEN